MDDLHSSRQLYCSLFSPRYLEKDKWTQFCNYEIVTSKVPQHTSLWHSWFKYFFRDSHYGRGCVDCRPCYSLRGRLLHEESDTRGNTTGRGVSQASTLLLPLGIQVLQKKKKSGTQYLKTGIHRVESWIQDQWRIQGRGPGYPAPGLPVFLRQAEARRAEKNFCETEPPPFSQGPDDRTLPPLIWRSGSATKDYRLLRDWDWSNFVAVDCSNELISKFSLPLQEFVILAANMQGRRNK